MYLTFEESKSFEVEKEACYQEGQTMYSFKFKMVTGQKQKRFVDYQPNTLKLKVAKVIHSIFPDFPKNKFRYTIEIEKKENFISAAHYFDRLSDPAALKNRSDLALEGKEIRIVKMKPDEFVHGFTKTIEGVELKFSAMEIQDNTLVQHEEFKISISCLF